jgi:hypothetical protein
MSIILDFLRWLLYFCRKIIIMNINIVSPSSAKRKILSAWVIWVITYIICLLIIKKLSPHPAIGIVLSLIPAVAFAYVIYSFIKNISLMDELERRIYLEASAIAFSLCLLFIMILGMLNLVITLNEEDWNYRHIIPFLFVFYFIGLAITKKKYS